MQKYTFPHFYQEKIESLLQSYDYTLERPKALADAVLKLSDHYQKTARITPWENPEYIAAYASYFFPLNYVRNLKLWKELKKVNFPNHYSQVIDYGSGLGSASLAAIDSDIWSKETPLYAIDHSTKPTELLGKFLLTDTKFKTQMPTIISNALGIFSYSWNELEKTPKWLFNLDHIFIAEPSTATLTRKLMTFRQELIEKEYSIWAPCTHAQECPLLTQSKTDWCHDRIHWDQPSWFQEIEKHLPIKNSTLTVSYLLASKEKPENNYFGRIIGDELKEKGKTRWMFCRENQREFLSHLSRNGPPPDWKRGHLFETPLNFDHKAQELRLK